MRSLMCGIGICSLWAGSGAIGWLLDGGSSV